jgi:hypothetical protein
MYAYVLGFGKVLRDPGTLAKPEDFCVYLAWKMQHSYKPVHTDTVTNHIENHILVHTRSY